MIHVLSHRLSASGVRLSQTRTSSAELPVSCKGRGKSRLQPGLAACEALVSVA